MQLFATVAALSLLSLARPSVSSPVYEVDRENSDIGDQTGQDSDSLRLLEKMARLGHRDGESSSSGSLPMPIYFRKRFLGNGWAPGGVDNVNGGKEALAMCVFASKNNLPSAKDLCTRSRRAATVLNN